eukprot:COSAG06_NODE_56966_length_282_cov_0.852459_1_plen_56_part_10
MNGEPKARRPYNNFSVLREVMRRLRGPARPPAQPHRYAALAPSGRAETGQQVGWGG